MSDDALAKLRVIFPQESDERLLHVLTQEAGRDATVASKILLGMSPAQAKQEGAVGARSFHCPLCQYPFQSEKDLNLHIDSYHVCSNCQNEGRTKQVLIGGLPTRLCFTCAATSSGSTEDDPSRGDLNAIGSALAAAASASRSSASTSSSSTTAPTAAAAAPARRPVSPPSRAAAVPAAAAAVPPLSAARLASPSLPPLVVPSAAGGGVAGAASASVSLAGGAASGGPRGAAGGEIDPVVKEKRRAHLVRFFGERPTTQELFPVQLGLVKRPDASVSPPQPRRESDPTKQDDFVKTVQRNKLEKIFGVRPVTQDLVEAIESARGTTTPTPPRENGASSASPARSPHGSPMARAAAATMPSRPAGAAAAPVSPTTAARAQTLAPTPSKNVTAAAVAAAAEVDPLAAEWAKTRFQQPLVHSTRAAPVAAPVVKRHRQTLIEADYAPIDSARSSDRPELLYGQLLPEMLDDDNEFDEKDFQRGGDDKEESQRLRNMLRASVLERSRALVEQEQLSRELLVRRLSQHVSQEQVEQHRRSGALTALARLSTAISAEQVGALAAAAAAATAASSSSSSTAATAARAVPPAAPASRAEEVAWKLLTADSAEELDPPPPPPADSNSSSPNSSAPATMALPLSEAVAVAAKTPERRQYVVRELVTTERNYINDVRILVDQYLTPLCHDESLSEVFAYDTTGAIVALLSTAQLIVESSLVVFDNLVAACGRVSEPVRGRGEASTATSALALPGERGETVLWGAAQVGDVFLHSSMAELFTLFGVFVNHQASVYDALTRAVAAKKAVFLFLERQRLDVARSQGLRVFDYLAKPFQRSTKYGLLLRDLLKETPESHPDFAAVTAACEFVANETTHMNETKALSDNLNKLREIAQRLELPKPHFVLVPRRCFIREGALFKDGRVERQFFLFNDVLVYAKRKTGSNFKAMAVVNVSDLVVTDVAESKIFLLHRRDTAKTYTLHAKDAKDKMEWVRDLQIAVIRETSFTPPSLFTTSSTDRLQAVAVQVSGAAPPRAIVRLWFGSDVQAFVIFAETTVGDLLQQFVAKQANIAKAGAKAAPTEFQIVLRRDNGMYCEETKLKNEERPVLLQHALLRDGTVFGEDFDNCFVVRHVTEKPQNMVSIRRKPSELSASQSLRTSNGADSPSVKTRKLTLFKRSARSPSNAALTASSRPASASSRPGSGVGRPQPPGASASASAASARPPSKLAASVAPFEIDSERDDSSSTNDRSTLEFADRPLPLPGGVYMSMMLSEPLPAVPGEAPPAEAPPVPVRASDVFVQETVRAAQTSVEALETAIEASKELGAVLKNDPMVRGLIERVAQSREQLERYLAVGVENRNVAAAARAVVRRATSAISFYTLASSDKVYDDLLVADDDDNGAEDFVSDDEDELIADDALDSDPPPPAPKTAAPVEPASLPVLLSAADVYRQRTLPQPAPAAQQMYVSRQLPRPK